VGGQTENKWSSASHVVIVGQLLKPIGNIALIVEKQYGLEARTTKHEI